MRRFLGLSALVVAALSASVFGQEHPLRGKAEPDQPVRPQVPILTQRAPQEQPAVKEQVPPPPFTLTAQEEAQVDKVLQRWEDRNKKIDTFDCRFTRWTYDVVFGPPGEPKYVDFGILRYKAPDRGVFRIETTQKEGKESPIEDARSEHWISDGKSIFEFSYIKKQLVEHKLPPELQGKAIADSPLPFLFGAEAKKLKQRYYLRIVTPPNVQDQIYIQAYPRTQQDAANFHHTELRISAKEMLPYALMLVQPNQKDYTSYQFFDIEMNDPFRLFKGDPFRPSTPLGWQRIVEEAPTAQATRVPNDPTR